MGSRREGVCLRGASELAAEPRPDLWLPAALGQLGATSCFPRAEFPPASGAFRAGGSDWPPAREEGEPLPSRSLLPDRLSSPASGVWLWAVGSAHWQGPLGAG